MNARFGCLLALIILASSARLAVGQPAVCLAPGTVGDADVARHAADLADPALCISERIVEDGDTTWRLVVIDNAGTPGPLWAVPHDEEDEAFAAGVRAVRLYGGTMVAIENADARLVDGKDPNQYFARTPEAAATCPATGGASAASFARPGSQSRQCRCRTPRFDPSAIRPTGSATSSLQNRSR